MDRWSELGEGQFCRVLARLLGATGSDRLHRDVFEIARCILKKERVPRRKTGTES